jgi:hypothetical protein
MREISNIVLRRHFPEIGFDKSEGAAFTSVKCQRIYLSTYELLGIYTWRHLSTSYLN